MAHEQSAQQTTTASAPATRSAVFVRWFDQVTRLDAASVGGKGAATRIYVNLAMADQAESLAAPPVDGVGLLRAEFMLLDALENAHPRTFVSEQGGDAFIERMAVKLLRITRAFAPDR